MKKASKADWARVDAMTDEDIDTSDIPPLDELFFERAKLRMPKQKVPITLNIDKDILNWFQAQDERYEERINAALKLYAEAHKQFAG